MNPRKLSCAVLLASAVLSLPSVAQQTGGNVPTGNAERGKVLFSDTYNCYACHGFDAQTGERRLVPMRYPLDGFIKFVQNSPLPNMPAMPAPPIFLHHEARSAEGKSI